jgi:hypothetical protein
MENFNVQGLEWVNSRVILAVVKNADDIEHYFLVTDRSPDHICHLQ